MFNIAKFEETAYRAKKESVACPNQRCFAAWSESYNYECGYTKAYSADQLGNLPVFAEYVNGELCTTRNKLVCSVAFCALAHFFEDERRGENVRSLKDRLMVPEDFQAGLFKDMLQRAKHLHKETGETTYAKYQQGIALPYEFGYTNNLSVKRAGQSDVLVNVEEGGARIQRAMLNMLSKVRAVVDEVFGEDTPRYNLQDKGSVTIALLENLSETGEPEAWAENRVRRQKQEEVICLRQEVRDMISGNAAFFNDPLGKK